MKKNLSTACCGLLASVLLPFYAMSADVWTWTGAVDSYWTNAANWSVNGSAATMPPGRFKSNAAEVGFFDSSVEFGEVASGAATVVNLDGFLDVSNLVVKAGAPRYQFGISGTQSLTIHSTAGVFRVEANAPAPKMIAQFGAWRYAGKGGASYNDSLTPKLVNDSDETIVLSKMFYVEHSARSGEKAFRFEGSGNIKISGLCAYKSRFYLDLAQKEGAKLIWDCDGRGDWLNGMRKIRNSSSCVSEIELSKNSYLSGYTGMGPFESIDGTLILSGKGTYLCNVGTKTDTNTLDGNKYLDQQNTVKGTMYVRCRVESVNKDKDSYFGGWTVRSGNGITWFDGEIDNEMKGGAKILPNEANISSSYGVKTIGKKGEKSPLGYGEVILSGGGRLLYAGVGEECTKPFVITNRVPGYLNAKASDRLPAAIIEHGGTGKLVFNSEIISYGKNLKGSSTDASLTLASSTSHEAELGTLLSDNIDSGKLNLVKTGFGMWRLTKANLFTGATTISGGALVLGVQGSIENSSAINMQGGDLVIECAAGTTKKVSLPIIKGVNGRNRIIIADGVAVETKSISIQSATIDIQIAGSGSFKVTSQSSLPTGVTINGSPANIDANGFFVRRTYKADVEIAARGGKIPNASNVTVGITSSGNENAAGITLADGVSSASINALVQKCDTHATVSLAEGQKLSVATVAIEDNKAAVTIGTAPGVGSLSSEGDIEFDNASKNYLTVLSSLQIPSSKSIKSSGDGLLRLWWPLDWSGNIFVANGTVALTNDSAISFNSALAGGGTFRKEGTGIWSLSKAQDTTFFGDFAVAGGAVEFSNSKVFGSGSLGSLIVTNGGELKVTGNVEFPVTKKIRLAGAGSGTSGIIQIPDTGKVDMKDVELTGDTVIGGAYATAGKASSLWITGDSARSGFEMNGHTLTKHESVGIYLSSVKIKKPGPIVFNPYDVSGNHWNVMYFYNDSNLGDSNAPAINTTVGSRLYLDGNLVPQSRKIRIDIPSDAQQPEMSISGGVTGSPDGVNTNFAHWKGPIEIVNSGTYLSLNPWDPNNADRYITISGPVSGKGGINLGKNTKSGIKGHVSLMSANNTYEGDTIVNCNSGASLILFNYKSIPDWSKLHVYGGRVSAVAGDGFFTAEDVLAAANSSANWNTQVISDCRTFTSTLAVNTSYTEENKYAIELSDSSITREDGGFSIGHDGKGELTVTGAWSKPVNFSSFDGVLKFTGKGTKVLGIGSIFGNWEVSTGEVLIDDAEDVRFTPNNSVMIGGYALGKVSDVISEGRMTIRNSRVTRLPSDLNAGWNSNTILDSTVVGTKGTGIISVEGDSIVTNRHVVGYESAGRGAIYQRSGTVVDYAPWLLGINNQYLLLGNNGYGYYEMEDGMYEIVGRYDIGSGENGQGVFVQKGGRVDHSMEPKTDYNYNWTLANGKNTAAVVMIAGGIHTNRADTAMAISANSRVYFTVEGNGKYINLRPANPNRCSNGDSLTILNFNGGVFGAHNIAKARQSYPEGVKAEAYCNFNGGTFLMTGRNGNSIFGQPNGANWNRDIDRVTVYEKGAAIDVPSANYTMRADVPLSAPTGNGVASVIWNDTGVKYVGSPIVEIIGDGTGASAFAEFDSVNRKVTGIKVTSPGCDYTWAKAVIRYANEAPITNSLVNLATFTSGSFTKKGPGTLEMNVANSYGGDTIIEEGKLRLNVAGAIPEGSKIVFRGGALSFAKGVSLSATTFAFDLLNPVVYPDTFEFPKGSKIEIANLEKADKDVESYDVVTFNGGLSGAIPEIANNDDLLPRWNLIKSGKSLKLRYSRGTVVSIR